MPDALLDIIAGHDTDGYYEIRGLQHGRPGARQAWFPLGAREDCRKFISSHATRYDVFVGVAPRVRREGGKSAIRRGWCLWADIDTVEGVALLGRFRPAPSLVIRSGTGDNVHAYWALSMPLPPVWLERANRRLAFALGADMKAVDAARILRPDGTLNHKSTLPNSVSVWRGPNASQVPHYTVVEVCKNLADPPMKPPVRGTRVSASVSSDPLLGISSSSYYERLTGRPVTRGNVVCPFHGEGKERNPSMRLYETTFFCFGCSIGGSVIQFGAHHYGYSTPVRGAAYRELRDRLREDLL